MAQKASRAPPWKGLLGLKTHNIGYRPEVPRSGRRAADVPLRKEDAVCHSSSHGRDLIDDYFNRGHQWKACV